VRDDDTPNDQDEPISGGHLRSAALPKSLRGYDEASTRALLNSAADRVDALEAQNLELRAQIDELRIEIAAHEEQAPETMSRTIFVAARLAKRLLSDAKADADAIRSDTESRKALEAEQAKAVADELEEKRRALLDKIRADSLALSQELDRELSERLGQFVHLLTSAKSVGDRLASIGSGAVPIDSPPPEKDERALLKDIQPGSHGPLSPT
jgi:small-conductance mechanosensitive channel